MARPLAAALTTITTVLLLASVNCGIDSPPSATTTVTPSPTTPTQRTVAPSATAPAQPTVTFTTRSGGTAKLTVEIADAPWSRSRGLMNRASLPEDAGMLFVWPEDTSSGFWMKDTTVPLSVAFIDAAGVILDIQDMQPLDETLHMSPAPFRYAVEANQGWFAGHGIEVGDDVALPEGVSAPGG